MAEFVKVGVNIVNVDHISRLKTGAGGEAELFLIGRGDRVQLSKEEFDTLQKFLEKRIADATRPK